MTGAFCIPLGEVTDEAFGGKAAGLGRLIRDGFTVPDGFVVVDAESGSMPDDLAARYEGIGAGKVAVRSSATGEDSAGASFAGQYETILNVEGLHALEDAIESCVRSVEAAHASAYRTEQTGDANTVMHVVVQTMVDARAAGVLFTADPVSARRDRVVIDAVLGLGESLVSGARTPDHWLYDKTGSLVRAELQDAQPVLDDHERVALLEGALRAEAAQRAPLDMEWAIDHGGRLWWLQARPITQLPADPNELDTKPAGNAVYTWANIGEMMPGAVTPLTYSVTGRGIDIGMQRMYRSIGSHVPETRGLRYVAMFHGHLFLDLRTLSDLAADVAGSTKAQMCLALCGRDIEELDEPEPASRWRRTRNGVRYFQMLLSAKRYGRALDELKDSLSLPEAASARSYYEAIDKTLPAIWRAYELHLMSSAAAGALSPILLGIVAKGKEPTGAHHADVAEMLAGATEVESADIAAGAERIVALLARHRDARTSFADADPDAASQWLQSAEAGEAGAEFARYLGRHGHRAVRELELRQQGWAIDPRPVVASLQSGVRARLEGASRQPRRDARTAQPEDVHATHPYLNRLMPIAHGAVRCREHTKSGLVAVTTHFKIAYRELGDRLVREGLLPDQDTVFFLTHEELGRLVRGEIDLEARAVARRRTTDVQMGLRFPEVFTGRPEPLTEELDRTVGGALVGRPVSRGVVRGIARVVKTLDEASALRPGEILVAPITDVGWTPYFNLIAGLATDVGSAVSHGAVVAREYGLPAVVNLRVATSRFQTGDRVVLDGDAGTLSFDDDGP
ncbi:MAG: PEP/pyruvate-binding domain-containing protein [Polyangiales bacterium]